MQWEQSCSKGGALGQNGQDMPGLQLGAQMGPVERQSEASRVGGLGGALRGPWVPSGPPASVSHPLAAPAKAPPECP